MGTDCKSALSGAKSQYLDDFQDYINHLNFRINAKLGEYLISFKSLEEANAFQDFMKPTFEMLAKKYTEGLVDKTKIAIQSNGYFLFLKRKYYTISLFLHLFQQR